MGKLNTYIALFRGINVGGKNILKMAALKEVLQKSPFQEAQTYIQSGNVVFKSIIKAPHLLAYQLEKLVKDTFGIDVPIIVLRKKELEDIIKSNPFPPETKDEISKLYISYIKGEINTNSIESFAKSTITNDKFHISKKNIYTFYDVKYSASKLNNMRYEKKLNCIATTRNWKTTLKLLEMATNN